ncbi:hypothetical protein DENIS_4126 [Desulfonema ishimotonii]|uniref:CRISPR-associated protein n=1 Tax=Desulfonema ishimotonii TaxID=45657 RepID=A0A401G1R8_9BACT|nr:CRISPR-associated protein Csx20 [Desulfonema ishimotonii]GBC63133.1 hypothetical protein DENIS_4126 [Desulfonema ishimotonii]
MQSLFLLFNHTLTPAQEADARASLGVDRIVTPPQDLRAVWSGVPPDLPEISPYLKAVRDWLLAEARLADYVLIQGDFGACYLMVRFAFDFGMIPVYATTRREAVEEPQPDGTIKITHHFNHRRFRKYGV